MVLTRMADPSWAVLALHSMANALENAITPALLAA